MKINKINNRFAYVHPLTVRYADLDPQRHVNNAAIITYLETARMGYYQASGIWDGRSFDQFGMVVAAININYRQSIQFGQKIGVGLRVTHMGNKSIRFRFLVFEQDVLLEFADGEIVMVAYDPVQEHSISIPPDWRQKIDQYEKTGVNS